MLEVILTVSTAYLLKRWGVFTEEHARVLVNYVLYFALPLLSFKIAHGLGLSREVLLVGAGAWLVILCSLLLAFFLGRLLRLNPKDLKTLVVISAFGNTAFLGYPYSFAYYGQQGLEYAIIYDNVGSFLAVSSVGFLILSGRLDLRGLFLFPPFLGLVMGFALRGYALPEQVWRFVDFSASSLLPVVLFSLGLSLNFAFVLKEKRLLAFAVCTKMFLVPGLAVLLLMPLPLEPVAYKVSVLESSMPTMVTASALVLKYGLNHHLAFASSGLGVVVSFFSVPLWVFVLERLGV